MIERLSAVGAMPVEDLFAYLEGNWQLSRTINDLRLNMPGAMEGQAVIARQENGPGLSYREEGKLRFGDYRETVFRNYDFIFPELHRAQVLFSDGRRFHELDLRQGISEVEHLCGEDIYRGRFRTETADIWQSSWFISGPSKELTLDNRYQRLS